MAQTIKFPECPYRGVGNNRCSHKHYPKRCIYVFNAEKCKMYQDWCDGRLHSQKEEKSKIEGGEAQIEHTDTESDND